MGLLTSGGASLVPSGGVGSEGIRTGGRGRPDFKERKRCLLTGAVNGDLIEAALAQCFADFSSRERGVVAVFAEVVQHDPAETLRGDFGDEVRRLGVRQMTVTGGNPLFGGPGSLPVVLEQHLVVICFDMQGVEIPEALPDQMGDMAGVAERAQTEPFSTKNKSHRIHGIMGHGKTFHFESADREGIARMENLPFRLAAKTLLHHGAGVGSGKDRETCPLPEEHIQPAGMVRMLMGQNHGRNLVRHEADRFQPLFDLPRAEADVDENVVMSHRHDRAVATAAAAEDCEPDHASLLLPVRSGASWYFQARVG